MNVNYDLFNILRAVEQVCKTFCEFVLKYWNGFANDAPENSIIMRVSKASKELVYLPMGISI